MKNNLPFYEFGRWKDTQLSWPEGTLIRPFCSKIMFPYGLASIPTHLAPFWKYFPKITKKIDEYWNFVKKWLNMSKISKFCNFWAISTCNTSKESIFHIEFNFKQKKYDLFEEKLKKSNFLLFFVKIYADQLS